MKVLLALLCCFELLFITFLVNTAGPFLSPVILFSLSLGVAFCYLKIASQPQLTTSETNWKIPPKVMAGMQWVLFAACSYLIVSKLKHFWWYDKTYGDPFSKSDIIPQINTLITRFLAGQQPYSRIYFDGYDMFPTYMPFQWLPYIPLELAKKDYRWVPFFAMWGMSFYYFLRNRKVLARSWWGLLVPVWPLLVWGEFMMHDNKIFVFTVEGLIAAYYFFVAESIGKKSIIPLAIGIGICMFSRYSIIFWVPLCAFLFFVAGFRRNALIICLVPVVFFVLFYWLPFMSRDSSIFMQGYEYHTKAAYFEWVKDLRDFSGKVYVYGGLGFSSYAMKYFPGEINNKLLAYKNVHFAACILSVLLLGWYYARNRSKYDLKVFMLFSFKVYITVFYAFIQIPYKYLFFVPMVVSAALFAAAFAPRPVKDNPTLPE